MNTLTYSDEEGKVIAAALAEWRQHLSISLDRIPKDAQFIPAPDRAIQLVAGTVDGILARLQDSDMIEVLTKAGRFSMSATRDGELQFPAEPINAKVRKLVVPASNVECGEDIPAPPSPPPGRTIKEGHMPPPPPPTRGRGMVDEVLPEPQQ